MDLSNPEHYINRELSWLDFNGRVLEEAQDLGNPLLERVKFLAIVANNLDEFFEVRVAGLQQLNTDNSPATGPDGLTPAQQLRQIADKAHSLVHAQYRCWNEQLLPALAAERIHLWEARRLKGEHLAFIKKYWHEELEPVLTPIVIDPAHPFPRVLNKALSIAALLQPGRGQPVLGVVTVPRVLPRILSLPPLSADSYHFVSLAGIINFHLGQLFNGYQVLGSAPFRVTRNSELYVNEEEADNLLEEIAQQLENRRKGDAVRLEIEAGGPDQVVELLREEFELDPEDLYLADGPVNLNRVMTIFSEVKRPDLKYPAFSPVERHLPKNPESFFKALRQRDVMLHHPYESFSTVIDFIDMAAADPKVLAIKQTLYRTGDDSQVVQALIRAAERNKEVTVLVELKARFDEAFNIAWAKQLEESGVHVIYGLMGLKTHCKLSLLVRRDRDCLRRYAHLGTGNYNQSTARFYTDLGLITAREDITSDVAQVFNLLTARSKAREFEKLLVAPSTLMGGLLRLIERERQHALAGKPAAIIAKMNGLMDPEIIRALYRASQAGVQLDLIVRGICCLRPGLPGISENIRVVSIIGRYLEHSRAYFFANAGHQEIWAGSADWMNRNLRGRVEVIFPIEDPRLKERAFCELLELCLRDRVKARGLNTDGTYTRLQPATGEVALCMQDALMDMALGKKVVLPPLAPAASRTKAKAKTKVKTAAKPPTRKKK
ncbi:MAG: polyphosphate kinase 1 [Candidatus Latescibacteria bacterium]|nr:polyphosphate kinase 1 [Candidatus Latescibacterota bacterium]